ncbi:unnamed protein product [Ilex paraguariensis]|uniref:Secreted protein n=1 Tax=Ilex paraguariensis TaxID=185542 RepID=A0ABC8QUS9_9AQUA
MMLSCFQRTLKLFWITIYFILTPDSVVLAADPAYDEDDVVYTGEHDGSSDDEGMLYLPDLEKARGAIKD